MVMRAFITKDGRRYLTTNGPNVAGEDTEVPLRKEDYHALVDDHFPEMDLKMEKEDTNKPSWLNSIGFRTSEVVSIVSTALMVSALYFALRGDINVQNVVLSYQGEQIKELKVAQANGILILHNEMEQLKNKVDTQITAMRK